jgi:hypothetical protein
MASAPCATPTPPPTRAGSLHKARRTRRRRLRVGPGGPPQSPPATRPEAAASRSWPAGRPRIPGSACTSRTGPKAAAAGFRRRAQRPQGAPGAGQEPPAGPLLASRGQLLPCIARRSGPGNGGCRDSRRRALGSGPILERRCGPGLRPPRARLSAPPVVSDRRSESPAWRAAPECGSHGDPRRAWRPAGTAGRPHLCPMPHSSPVPRQRQWDGVEIR